MDYNERPDFEGGFTCDTAPFDMKTPIDYKVMMDYLDACEASYPFLVRGVIGTTIAGRSIPFVRLGAEKTMKNVLYVGSHHAMEWITTSILLRFIGEYCCSYKLCRRMYSISMPFLFNNRTIYVVPMLNCDGVELQRYGIDQNFVMRNRLISMNGGSEDFSNWQANLRGVDLNHNYNAGFTEYKMLERELGIFGGGPTKYSGEYPESEPETASLVSFIRQMEPSMIITLHSQGEEIFYTSGGETAPRSRQIAKALSGMSGYKLSEPEGTAAYGGLTDWFIREFKRPSFTIECGHGTNPLPLKDFFPVYVQLREMLFTAPLLS